MRSHKPAGGTSDAQEDIRGTSWFAVSILVKVSKQNSKQYTGKDTRTSLFVCPRLFLSPVLSAHFYQDAKEDTQGVKLVELGCSMFDGA